MAEINSQELRKQYSLEDAKTQIENLRETISYHNMLYYEMQEPELSDAQYDALYRQLETLEKAFPEFDSLHSPTKSVGGTAQNTFNQVTHERPMLSLGKAMNFDELFTWLRSMLISGIKSFSVEPKLDGLACKLVYVNGVLKQGATRGDGILGEDITATVMLIPSIPKKINAPNGVVEVRGEVFLPKSGLAKVNKIASRVYKNVRNAASGILRSKTPIKQVAQELVFGAYMLVLENQKFDNHIESMGYLSRLGFKTTNELYHGFIVRELSDVGTEELTNMYFNQVAKFRDELDFEIDGMVIKANVYADQERLGSKTNVPNWAIAFKFEAQEKMTRLLGVEWLLGNKGNITPRAIVEAVEIGGVTVRKVTLHNLDEIKRLGIKIGDYVIIERRGDVIPKITRVVTELRTGNETDIVVPTQCPDCGANVVMDGVFIRCNNLQCGGQQLSKIENYVIATEIENFGPKIIEKVVEDGKVNDVADIYSLTVQDIANLERMGVKSATKIVNNIQASKDVPLAKVIAGLTIKNIGDTTSKDIAKMYGTLDKFLNAKLEELCTIEGIANTTAQYIVDWLNNEDNKTLINKLIAIGIGMIVETVQTSSTKLEGKKFGFTGALTISRKEMEDKIVDNGGEVISIKKGMDYLIIGNGAKDAKIDKAKSLGATVINEQEFNQLLR